MPLRRPREEGFQWTQDLGDVIACVAISQHAGRPPVVADVLLLDEERVVVLRVPYPYFQNMC